MVPVYVDEHNKVHQQGTTAYTTNTRDNKNLLIATKNPKSIRPETASSSETARPKVLGAHLIRHQPRLITNRGGDKDHVGGVENHVARRQ